MLKIIAPALVAALMLGQAPLDAAAQQPVPPERSSLPEQGKFDQKAFAEALKQCPAFKNDGDRQAMARAMAEAARSCPAFNGRLDPNAFAMALAGAARNYPALARLSPQDIVEAAKFCPWVRDRLDLGALAAAASRCPGLQKPADALGAKIDARMKDVVAALQENRKSADALIAAAREAGAPQEVISDMEKMSQAFRQFFMTAVSPQQIVESILAQPAGREAGSGLIITAPDGSAWLVRPQMTPPPPPRKGPKPPHFGPRPGPQPGMPPMPDGFQPQAIPGQPDLQPAPNMSGMPGIQMPPANVLQDPSLRQPQGQPAPQPDMVIIEETVEDMPYWPTKQQLGKDGVLKYLEKRAQAAGK